MEFVIPLNAARFILPVVCTGMLAFGLGIFCYLYARSRDIRYVVVAIAGACGMVFAGGEAMLLITGGWLHDARLGMQWHRIEQIAGAHFLYIIPLIMLTIIDGTPRWRMVNRVILVLGVVAAVFFTIAAFAAPELFISQTVHKHSWYFNEGDFGRGREGALYLLRDAILAPLTLYALAALVIELVRTRNRRLLLPPLIGTGLAIFGAADDLCNIHFGFRIGLFPGTDYSRFTLGITLFILWVMGGAIRHFLDLAQATDEARRRAVTEIDERRRAEAEREVLREQLYQAQKFEAVGMMAGGIAHDFNNLLTAIIGNVSLMRAEVDGVAANGICLGYAEQIMAAAERASTLTRQLLMFSRRQVVEPAPADLNTIIGDMERLLQRVIGESISIGFKPQGAPVTVLADTGQIEQVLLNLAANARDAMPDGGKLSISTGTRDVADDDHFRPLFPAAGCYGYFSIYDTGMGMDATLRQRIFEPFFTTKEAGKGSGLGLAIVFGIVSRHNGVITVESEPGRGTRFSIFFPLIDAQPPAPDVPVDAAAGGTETIMLVEDDASVRKVTRIMLQQAGYRVIEAGDGAQAMAEFDESPGVFDLVVSDVILPGINGRALQHVINDRRPDLPFLFISGYTADLIKRAGVLDEGLSYLAKPFTPAMLRSKVRALLDAPRD